MDALTLDQFAVFVAVADSGSFAAAAREMGRAQSAITYAIKKLEDQSGTQLFDRSSYRPSLTDAGCALLPRVRRILDEVGEFRLHAHGIARGLEAEIDVVVDAFLPVSTITPILRDFHETFPMVRVRLTADWQNAAVDALMEGRADVGMIVEFGPLPSELESVVFDQMDLIAVASPDHPLASLTGKIGPDVLRDHLQIVVANPNASRNERVYGATGINRWHVSDNHIRRALIEAGLGWGSMPRTMVEDALHSGRLLQLHPERWDASNRMPRFRLSAVKRRDRALGPAATWLMSRSGWPSTA